MLGSVAPQSTLLVVFHSRSGNTRRLVDAMAEGARVGAEGRLVIAVKTGFEAEVADVLGAAGIILATSANFGYMSGELKDFFERIYYDCLERTRGKPFIVVVKGDTDVDGAYESIKKITTGLAWKEALPPLLIVGQLNEGHLSQAQELAAGFAAGLVEGIF
jgi:multimeric flavodoxin WrbA